MATSSPGHISGEMLEINAEIQRLGKLLGISHTELDYLRHLPSTELRELRTQITSTLFDNQGTLQKLASATRIVPAGVTATLAEKVFGPMLAARIAGLVDVDRAVDIASRLPVPFLAEVATELDPRHVATILGQIPPATVAEVAKLLVAREEWVAMGTFYGYLPDASIRAAMSEADAPAMLQIAMVLDDKSRLAHVLDLAGADTFAQIAAAAEEQGLTPQLRALSGYLRPDQQAQLPF